MRLFLLLFLLLPMTLPARAQNNMRPVEALISKGDEGWKAVGEMMKESKNRPVVLPVNSARARTALFQTQATTRSPMGAIVYYTGGILVGGGWIRILGSGGNARMQRSLSEWNKGKTFRKFGEVPQSLLIADDAAGGYFLLNAGELGDDPGKVYYFSPDNLQYEPLNKTYSEFLHFCFNGQLEDFYKNMQWTGWRSAVAKRSGDSVYSFFPPLWSKETTDVNNVQRAVVPVGELYQLQQSLRSQMLQTRR